METTRSKTRKIIKSGGCLIITLPKDFVVKAGLKKGDRVGVTFDGRVLMVVVPREPL